MEVIDYGAIAGIVVVSTGAFQLIGKFVDKKRSNGTNNKLSSAMTLMANNMKEMSVSIRSLADDRIRSEERWSAFMRKMDDHFKDFRCLSRDVNSD